MKLILACCLSMLVGCAQRPEAPSPAATATRENGVVDIGASRVEVKPSSADQTAARAKVLAGVEGARWVFDPFFATARNARGDDIAVCGRAHQSGNDDTLFFAVYQGELLLWDERAPAGLSIENEFLTLICRVQVPVAHASGSSVSTLI